MELRTIYMILFIVYLTGHVYGGMDCDCDYHKGGCVISTPAPQGFKCKCLYKVLLACGGAAFPCSAGENCNAGRNSYCACKLGGGNCGGYGENLSDKYCAVENKEDSSESNTIHDGAKIDCDCSYHPGGCTINNAAPKDHKCVCVYKGFWSCSGWAKPCRSSEYCPGGLYTYCGCAQGKGNCKGYQEYNNDPTGKRCDLSKPKPQQCDCNRNSDWTSSSYSITNVTYNMDKMERNNNRLEVIGTKDIPNSSDAEQTIEFTISRSLQSTTSFQHKAGISIAVGKKYEASIPFVFKATAEISVQPSYSYSWGETKTIGLGYSHTFICNGYKKTHTICKVSVQRSDVNVPYVMSLTHKTIPNCNCESKGIWHGVDAFHTRLSAVTLEDCNKIVNGKCHA